MIEPPYRRSKTQSSHHIERVFLAENRLPFLNLDSLFLAGLGESEFINPDLFPIFQPYWAFQLVTEGKLLLEFEETRKTLCPGDVFLFRPGKKYYCGNPGKRIMKKRYIMLNHGVLVSLLCSQGALGESDIISGADPDYVLKTFNEMEALAKAGGENLRNRLSVMCYAFLLELVRTSSRAEKKGTLADLISYINANIANKHTLASLSKNCGVGEKTLERIFIRQLKCTPLKYIIQTRMQYARQMLLSSETPIESIAHLCGYRSFSFFSKEFKRLHGVTPGDFRNARIVTRESYSSGH